MRNTDPNISPMRYPTGGFRRGKGLQQPMAQLDANAMIYQQPVAVATIDLGSPEGQKSLRRIDDESVVGVPYSRVPIPESLRSVSEARAPRGIVLGQQKTEKTVPAPLLESALEEIRTLKKIIDDMQRTPPVIVKDGAAEAEVISLRSEVSALRSRFEYAESALERAGADVADLECKNRKLQEDLTKAAREQLSEKETHDRKTAQIGFLETKLAKSNRELESLQAKLQSAQTDNRSKSQLTMELDTLRRENMTTQTNLEQTHAALSSLKMEHDLLLKNNAAVVASNQKAHSRLATLEQSAVDNRFLEGEVQKYKDKLEEIENRLREADKKHEEELERSDIVHARQCNDLIRNIEEARVVRDTKTREIVDLKMVIEEYEKKEILYKDELSGVASLKKEFEYLEEDYHEVKAEVEKVKAENAKLKSRSQNVTAQDSIRGEDARIAFSKLRTAYDDVCSKNDKYRAQLKQATQDFKSLQRSKLLSDEHRTTIINQADDNNRTALNHLSDIDRILTKYPHPNQEDILASLALAMQQLGARLG